MSEEKRNITELAEGSACFLPPIRNVPPPPALFESYLPMLQGTATNNIRLAATKDIKIDRNGNATLEEAGFKAFMQGYAQLKGGLNTGAKKLLDLASLYLTTVNHYRQKEGRQVTTTVSISLEDYGRLRGYDLTPRMTSTPEEEEAEKKRRVNVMCEIRKKVNTELALLYSLSLSWTEPRKRDSDYKDVRVLQSKGIRGGYINMRFSEEMAAYLDHAYLMQYPIALQALDERNPRTYNVGYKLAFHHCNDNNRKMGTANIISVNALLEACGDIPPYEEVQANENRGHWERLIKDPLEKALESNLKIGVIQKWEYCNSKCTPLTEAQIGIPDYQTFISLYICFEMQDEPDQSARLQRKNERMEETKSKRNKALTKKKNNGGGA